MFFVLYDAWVLCLCLYGGDDTLIFPIDLAAMTFADQTWVGTGPMRLMIALHGKLFRFLLGKFFEDSVENYFLFIIYCASVWLQVDLTIPFD